MKNLLFAVLLVFFFAVACGDGVERIVPETASDKGGNSSENEEPVKISELEGEESIVEDSDEIQNDDENAETPDENSDSDSENGGTNSEPEGEEGEGEEEGDDEDAVSEDETTYPEAVERCPEGTTGSGEVCEYDNCGQYAYFWDFQSKDGKFVFKKDPADSCYSEQSTDSEQVPCCCGKDIYKFDKSGDTQAILNPLFYATSLNDGGYVVSMDEWVCAKAKSCEKEGLHYGERTDKCYECPDGFAFDFDDVTGKYRCSAATGN